MDVGKLVDVLRATLDPNQREQAEQQLSEVRNFFSAFKFLPLSSDSLYVFVLLFIHVQCLVKHTIQLFSFGLDLL